MAVMARCFLVLLSACVLVPASQACDLDSDCYGQCCRNGVCQSCTSYCIIDSDCNSLWTDKCCPNGACISSSDTCDLAAGIIAAIVVSVVVFVSIIAAIVACFFCACCPCYSRRAGVVLVQGQPAYNRFGTSVTTTTAVSAQQGMPPPGSMYQPQPGPYQSNQAQPGPYPPQAFQPAPPYSVGGPVKQ